MPELLTAIGLYALWELLPHRRQRDALAWFWGVVLLIAAAGLIYTVITTGSIPSPATGG